MVKTRSPSVVSTHVKKEASRKTLVIVIEVIEPSTQSLTAVRLRIEATERSTDGPAGPNPAHPPTLHSIVTRGCGVNGENDVVAALKEVGTREAQTSPPTRLETDGDQRGEGVLKLIERGKEVQVATDP